MIRMRYIICGPAGCGKTILARRLTEGMTEPVRFVEPCRPGRLHEEVEGFAHWVAIPQAQGDLTTAEWASADVVFMYDATGGSHTFQARVQLRAAQAAAAAPAGEAGEAGARRRASTPPPFRRQQASRPLDS